VPGTDILCFSGAYFQSMSEKNCQNIRTWQFGSSQIQTNNLKIRPKKLSYVHQKEEEKSKIANKRYHKTLGQK
jgi:hypothetical protein